MANPLSTVALARAAVRRPWLMIAAWVIVLVVSGGLASQVGTVLTNEDEVYADIEARTGQTLIDEHTSQAEPPSALVLIRSEDLPVDDPAFQERVQSVIGELQQTPHVVQVLSYYETGDPSLVSPDSHTLQVPVILDDVEGQLDVLDTTEPFDLQDGFEVVPIGQEIIDDTFNEAAASDLESEINALPVAFIVLLIVFGALVAAGVPVILALFSIVVALAMTTLVGQAFELSTFVTNMITMIGLAVGIDYSLLIVQRFREERQRGLSSEDAAVRAAGTATRAVLFSGFAVIIALAGLLIVPHSIFRSLSIGAILAVVAAVAAAMSLLPAILYLLGDRIDIGHGRAIGAVVLAVAALPVLMFLGSGAGPMILAIVLLAAAALVAIPVTGRRIAGIFGQHEPDPQHGEHGFWNATAHAVMRYPVVSIVATVGILAAAAIPYFTISLGFAGVSLLPEDSVGRRGYELLNDSFNAGVITPMDVVIQADDVEAEPIQAAITRLDGLLDGDEAFGEHSVFVSDDGTVAVMTVPVAGDAQEDPAFDALDRMRDDYLPEAFAGVDANLYVAGDTAETADFAALISDYTPLVFAFVLSLSFIILLVVFRSIVVPLKAILMNLLSVGAAYGLMVTVFQHGVGADFFGFTKIDRIESWIPLFMFAVVFGLSMDYHVFLLSRIRERYDQTRNNRDSVAYGVRSTASMITGAALIMVVVFSGFASGELVMFQQMGFGLAVAIVLDATIIRIVLVPASMALLGDWNWYLPSWLAWIPEVHVEGAPASHSAPAATGD